MAAVLTVADVLRRAELGRTVLLGELGLDGRVRPVSGILPAVLATGQARFTRVVVPVRQAGEAQLVDGLEFLGVGSLGQLVAVFRGDPMPDIEPIEVVGEAPADRAARPLDLADVVGQVEAKWAVEVAAAGRNHLMFSGPPRGGQDDGG